MNLCSFLQIVTLWGLSGHSFVELSTGIFFFFFSSVASNCHSVFGFYRIAMSFSSPRFKISCHFIIRIASSSLGSKYVSGDGHNAVYSRTCWNFPSS